MAVKSTALQTQILYVRHGEVPGNDPSPARYIYTGCGTDGSLTEKGRLQAEACAKRISELSKNGMIGKVAAVYTSPLKRAIQTGAPIAKELGVTSQERSDLREISWGAADGQLVAKVSEQYDALEEQVRKQYSDRKILWDHLPVFKDAEKYNALLKRSKAALAEIGNKHLGQTVVVVGHGRVLKTLIADAYGKEGGIPYPANCGIAEFSHSEADGLRLIQVMKDSSAMEGELSPLRAAGLSQSCMDIIFSYLGS